MCSYFVRQSKLNKSIMLSLLARVEYWLLYFHFDHRRRLPILFTSFNNSNNDNNNNNNNNNNLNFVDQINPTAFLHLNNNKLLLSNQNDLSKVYSDNIHNFLKMFKKDFLVCVKHVQLKYLSSKAQVTKTDNNILNTVKHQH